MYKQPLFDIDTGCIIILDSGHHSCYWGKIPRTWYPIVPREGPPILKYEDDLIEKMDKGQLYISMNNGIYTKKYALAQLSNNQPSNEKD